MGFFNKKLLGKYMVNELGMYCGGKELIYKCHRSLIVMDKMSIIRLGELHTCDI